MAASRDHLALDLRGVSSGYGDATIVRDVSLSVAVGEIVALLGPNGAGKSTLLKTISGLLRHHAGQVLINGVEVGPSPPYKRTALGLCHIPEGRAIFRSLTVKENIELQAAPGDERAALERAAAAFPILGERLNQEAGTLSGGQQQILAMARAYARSPNLIMVDEASLGLAPIIVDEVFSFLASVAEEGCALLIVDQFVGRALSLASRAYVLSRGAVAFAGTSAELEASDLFQTYGATEG